MGKVTSKYQVTVPKVIADRYGIKPGDELRWEPGDGAIRIVPGRQGSLPRLSVEERLALLQGSIRRQRERQKEVAPQPGADRGWTREDSYEERLRWPRS